MEPPAAVPASAEGQTDSPKAKSRTRKGGKSKGKRDNLPYLAQLSSVYQKQECKERFGEAFTSKSEYHLENEAALHNNPFPCCVLPKFIKEERFLEGLRDELMDQIFCEKNNDLYKFQQTDDLRKLSAPHVRAIRKLLYGTFLDWMREVTGIALTDQVDLTCSRYDHTDVLLCHDDELDSRRIAFILYLVPPWKAQDGGSLDLFTMDEHGQPSYINRSIQPAWNTLAWFEVTEASHHQVSEVLTEDKTRLSVNGWFHGPIVARPDRYVEPPLPLKPYAEMEESMFRDWINPIYLDPEVQCQIQERFETESEIELQGFLKEEKYHALLAALRGEKIKWVQKGPANKRRFFKAKDDEEDLPKIVTECMAFLQSEAMFLTLANLTGLTLHHLANQSDSEDEDSGQENCLESPTAESAAGSLEGEDPRSSSESEISCTEKAKPRKKRRKLNSDSLEKAAKSKASKDGDSEGWQQEYGGFTSYIAKDEDEELLSVNPAENSLALVYRDKDTLRFVKHINSQVNQMQNGGLFFDFASVYYE